MEGIWEGRREESATTLYCHQLRHSLISQIGYLLAELQANLFACVLSSKTPETSIYYCSWIGCPSAFSSISLNQHYKCTPAWLETRMIAKKKNWGPCAGNSQCM
ncbi:Hypp9421 [Branchiostoma lanceolatum]|uniref:Hypp9421 protein n=1 Tax=Branchiostoma lanceolatum TaxID=7740 RepID=A0A8S4MMB4_BRALA|nr:Hypp9421 [Branchiostoma lanceolatum]